MHDNQIDHYHYLLIKSTNIFPRYNVVCLTRKNFFGDVISDVDLVLGVRLEVEVVELDGLLVEQPHLVLVQLGGHDALVEVLCNKN